MLCELYINYLNGQEKKESYQPIILNLFGSQFKQTIKKKKYSKRKNVKTRYSRTVMFTQNPK